jgi:N-acetylmuramoyl-L-alanine amidase
VRGVRAKAAEYAVRSLGLLLALIFLAAAADPPAEEKKTVTISPELRVSIAAGDLVYLYAKPLPGESISQFARRFTEDPQTERQIRALNAHLAHGGSNAFLRVPYGVLSDNYKKIAIEALFPDDLALPDGWRHTVTAPSGTPESLWRIAEWFTGDGANYQKIRAAGHIASLETETGQVVDIPVGLLLPAFRLTALTRSEEEGPPPLTYGRDKKGRYALYRLQKGEALYSSVVVRFTGRIHAEDVNAAAAEIARRSQIRDVRSIPVGYGIKVPLEDLLPQYRPPDDPERIEYENARLEASQFVNRIRATNLSGVTLVLDPGHGGRDTGALVDGVAEARYAYDIACRVDRLLTRHTKAHVLLTVRDGGACRASNSDLLAASDGARVLTTPPYPIEDTTAGVHLRWYLANSYLRSLERKGEPEDRVVFVSIHADSLHPSVRGAMVYIPGEKFLRGRFGKSGGVYAARREVREEPVVAFTRRERIKAEGVSRDFAERIVAAFRRVDLPVHPYEPIRENVIRRGAEWVPAVLRYNRIPARVLLEVCNLNNDEDRALLTTWRYRERVARAMVEALVSFYDGSRETIRRAARHGTGSSKQAAKAGRRAR